MGRSEGVVVAAGDTFLRRRNGGDPFAEVGHLFADADLSFLNLETPITSEPVVAKKVMRLRADVGSERFLQSLGLTAVHIDNNHTSDCGNAGYWDTMSALVMSGVQPVGFGHRVEAETDDLKVVLAGYMVWPGEERWQDKMLEDIRLLAGRCDALVVSLHWGSEHIAHPSPAQIELAHNIIDEGASLIIGHHSHYLQGVEEYGRGLIVYSLGNFNFWHTDIDMAETQRLSAVLKCQLGAREIVDWDFVPIWIGPDFEPTIVSGVIQAGFVVARVAKLSADIAHGTDEHRWYEELGRVYIPQTLRGFARTIPRYGWCKVKRLLWWLSLRHTQRALLGLVRGWLKR